MTKWPRIRRKYPRQYQVDHGEAKHQPEAHVSQRFGLVSRTAFKAIGDAVLSCEPGQYLFLEQVVHFVGVVDRRIDIPGNLHGQSSLAVPQDFKTPLEANVHHAREWHGFPGW